MVHLGSRLADLRARGRPALLAYLMLGSAPPERWADAVDALVAACVTGLEIGFPFSDPMAEGPIIQKAATDALRRGTHFEHLTRSLAELSPRLPCAVMTYLNPILQHGVARSLEEIGGAGGSGLIVPDLPVEEVGPFRRARSRSGVDTVLLAAPVRPAHRLGRIVARTEGFLYLVSRYGTTGPPREGARAPSEPSRDLGDLIAVAHGERNELPVLVGFGVESGPDARRHRGSGADGVVAGSVFQRVLSGTGPVRAIGEIATDLLYGLETS